MRLTVNFPRHQSDETTVILVRHAQSVSNLLACYPGCCEQDILTEKGRRSAYLTGLALKKFNINAIYTSPLKRTQQTAIEILAALSTTGSDLPQMRQSKFLQGVDLRAWQGLSFQTVREQFPQDYHDWKQRPQEFQMEVPSQINSEETGNLAVCTRVKKSYFPVLDLYKQAEQFWQEILPRHRGATILVVGQSSTNRALISTALGLEQHLFHSLQQSNCGVSILKFPHSSRSYAKLESFNITEHLNEKLPVFEEEEQGLRLLFVASSNIPHQQIQQISQQLKDVPIDFCLSQVLDNSQLISEEILRYHPNIMQFQVFNDLLQVWQEKIQDRNQIALASKSDQKMRTGLVIVDELMIKSFLSKVLNLSLNQLQNWQLYPEAIHAIYYPLEHPAIVQTVNYHVHL